MAGLKGRKNGENLPRHHSGKFTEAFLDQYREDPYHQSVLLHIGMALCEDSGGPGYFRKDEIIKAAGVCVMADSIRWDILELFVEDEWGESLTPLSQKFWTRKHRTKSGKFQHRATTEEWKQTHAHECLAGVGPAKTVGYCKMTYSDGKFSVQRMVLDRKRLVGQQKHYTKRRDDACRHSILSPEQYRLLLGADGDYGKQPQLEQT